MLLRCPRCKLPLARTSLAGAELDGCERCGGLWFDRGELEAVIAASESAAVPRGNAAPADPSAGDARPPSPPPFVETAVRYLPCPHCATMMTRRQYERISGVILDYCNAHGAWADRGELERARAFVASGGVERREAREAEQRDLSRRVERFGRDRSARAEVDTHWVDLVFTRW